MKIAFGCDHAGFEEPKPYYKPEIVRHIETLGHEVVDCGTDGPDSVDYPDFAHKVCASILDGRASAGVLLCGTGIGMSITANRYTGIRAAVCVDKQMARLSRDHNDANVLCIGRRVLSLEACIEIIDTWLDQEFSDAERHARRVSKMR